MVSKERHGFREEFRKQSRANNERKLGIEEIVLQILSVGGTKVTLSTLVSEVTTRSGFDQTRIEERLMAMRESRKIRLEESAPCRTMFIFTRSPQSLWFWAALFSTFLALGLIFVTSGVGLYLRYVFGGLFILFLPGFSLIEFLYAKRKELDGLTRLALSIGLSLAIVPLVGLGLNYTPFGIRLIPAALSLACVTIIFLVLALRKKYAYYRLANDLL